MILTKNSNGEWVQVAGNGKAEYGASTVRTGTITTEEIGIGSFAEFTITFDTPMPDSDYHITWEWNTAGGNLTYAIVTITEKTANGFKLYVRNADAASSSITSHVLSWCAFKLYTDTEYNSLLDLPENVSALQTGKQDILTVSQTTIAVTNGGIQLAKYGRIVQASFQIVADNISADFTSGVWTHYGNAGIIPAAYRPLIPVYCGKMVTEMPVLMRVTTDGTLQYYWTGGTLGYEYEWTKTWISAQ